MPLCGVSRPEWYSQHGISCAEVWGRYSDGVLRILDHVEEEEA